MTTAARRGILAIATFVILLAVGATFALVLPEEELRRWAGALEQASFAPVTDAERAERDTAMAWVARVLLVLAALWLVIGMLAARTRLVRRPGAAAVRSTWLSSTRPWRARESTLGMLPLDRRLTFGVPAALLVGTSVVQASFLALTELVITLLGWGVVAIVLRLLAGRRSPWPVFAAAGGALVGRCTIMLGAMSVAGPGGFWDTVWANAVTRTVYVALVFALFVWVFVAAGWALVTQLQRPARAAAVG